MPLNRRKEREIVFQMLFSAQFSPEADSESLFETLSSDWEEEGVTESEYIRSTVFGVRAYAEAAREKIESCAKDWKVSRFSKTTLTVLQLAIYEMDKREDVPVRIAINEAVELAKRFDEEGGRKFVNGILGTLAGK